MGCVQYGEDRELDGDGVCSMVIGLLEFGQIETQIRLRRKSLEN